MLWLIAAMNSVPPDISIERLQADALKKRLTAALEPFEGCSSQVIVSVLLDLAISCAVVHKRSDTGWGSLKLQLIELVHETYMRCIKCFEAGRPGA